MSNLLFLFPGAVSQGIPDTIPGLEVWLDANDITTITKDGADKVSEWRSKANQGTVTQGNAPDQPTHGVTLLNGHPTVEFASLHYMQSAAFSSPFSQPNTIFVVGKRDTTLADNYFIDGIVGGSRHADFVSATNTNEIFAGTGLSDGNTVNLNPEIHTILFNTASTEFYINGVRTIAGVEGSQTLTGLTVGASSAIAGFLDGFIAEIIIYDRLLTAQERLQVENFLSTKWAITVTRPTDVANLVFWMDAADIGSITKDGADKVSQASDKSVEGNNAVQGTALDQGTWTVQQLNGRSVIIFDANDHLSVVDDATLNFDSGDGYTIFIALEADGYINQGSGINALLSKGAATLGSDTYNLQIPSSDLVAFQSGNNELIQNNDGEIDLLTKIITCRMTNATTIAEIFLNKGIAAVNGSATVGSDNASDLFIGGDSGVVRYTAC